MSTLKMFHGRHHGLPDSKMCVSILFDLMGPAEAFKYPIHRYIDGIGRGCLLLTSTRSHVCFRVPVWYILELAMFM